MALDDFGTGYGTLTELRHLHLHELKIDQSFVHDVLGDPDDERVVATVVSIARPTACPRSPRVWSPEAILKKNWRSWGHTERMGTCSANPSPSSGDSIWRQGHGPVA